MGGFLALFKKIKALILCAYSLPALNMRRHRFFTSLLNSGSAAMLAIKLNLKTCNILNAHAMHKHYFVILFLLLLTSVSLCRAEVTAPTAAAGAKSVQMQASAPTAVEQGEPAAYWGNILFVLAIVGLLQGLTSRAGVWPLVFVALIMPLIAAWGVLSGADTQTAGREFLSSFGLEFLWNFLSCVAGWLAGAAIRHGLFKLLSSHVG